MNLIAVTILIFLVIHFFFKTWLSSVNVRHLRRYSAEPPSRWAKRIDLQKLPKAVAYGAANTNFGHIQRLMSLAVAIAILYSGILPVAADYCLGFRIYPVFQGSIFVFIFGMVSYLAGIPFSILHDFHIERKFGFSTITYKTWILDQIKSIILALVLGFLLVGVFLLLIEKAGIWWWLFAWVFFNLFQILVSFLFPVVLAPIFFKFTPLKDEDLNRRILDLVQTAKFPVAGVFQIDASRRSRHSNAFFAGFGKTRRIALFDTLLDQHTHDEILAILAHEIGHWKKGHVIKGILIGLVFSAIGLFVVALLLDKLWLYDAFGLLEHYKQSGVKGPVAAVGLMLVGVLFSPISFVLEPFSSWLSRRHEYQADAYSVSLYPNANSMEDALFRLSQENMSNLFPHPLYVLFHYSHPTLFQRISALEKMRKDRERLIT